MSRSSIATTLKAKRKEANLSIEEVCCQLKRYEIELSKNSLYNYESGYRQPDADTLMALCEIYRIDDILYAFGYRDKLKKPEKSPDVEISTPGDGLIAQIMHCVEKMTLDQQRAILSSFQALLEQE